MNSNSESNSNSLTSRDFDELELGVELAKNFAELELNSQDFGINNLLLFFIKQTISRFKVIGIFGKYSKIPYYNLIS